MKIKPVIMAGGQGARLWPLSCSINPKQFLKTLTKLSLLQKTLIRNKPFGMPLVITGDRHEFITKEQAAEINTEIELITEPLAKNTAICAVITALAAKNNGFDTVKLDLEIYNKAKAVSIDHAIIEHIAKMVMVKANFAWNDLGTWHSLWQIKQKDITDNYCEGNVVVSDTTNSYISSDNKLTTVVGLDNIIVINSKNGLLVADKSKAAEIKQLAMQMEEYRQKEV